MADEFDEGAKLPEDARIESLDERLRRAQEREAARTGTSHEAPDANERLGQRVFSLLVGGLLGGTVIGWVLDRLFDTGNVLLIVGLVLGILGGFYSIVKLVGRK